MNYDIHDGIGYLTGASNLDELRQIFERLMCRYGFDLFALQFTPNARLKTGLTPLIIANYEKKWVEHYHQQNYHLIDPVITVGTKNKRPFLWSDTWQGIELNKKQRGFFHEAHDFGVSTGVGIPVLSPNHSNGMISLVSSVVRDNAELKAIIAENDSTILILSIYFQQMADYFVVRDNMEIHSISLTIREKDCLRWAAMGKTNGEIASIIGLSVKTVEAHFTTCYKKLNAVSREQAVAKALINRSIEL